MPLLRCFSFCSSHNFSMQSHVYGPNDMGRISDTAGKRTRARTQHQHQCPENYTIPPSLPTQRSTRQLTPSFIRTEICDVYYCHYYISFFLCFCFSFSVSLSAFFFLFCFIAFEKLRVSPLPLSRLLQRLYTCAFATTIKKVFTLFPFEFLYCCYFTSPTVRICSDTKNVRMTHGYVIAISYLYINAYVRYCFLSFSCMVFFFLFFPFLFRFFIAREHCLLVYAVEILFTFDSSQNQSQQRRAPTHAHCIIALRFHHNVYFVHLSAFTFTFFLLYSGTRSALSIHAYTYV